MLMYDNLWKWHADEHLIQQYILHMQMKADAMVECSLTKKSDQSVYLTFFLTFFTFNLCRVHGVI